MPIGEFGGGPAAPAEGAFVLSSPMYWLYEMSHAALNPSRALADATRLFFKNPVNPLTHTTFGKSLAASSRNVRALDAPLQPAGVAHFLDVGRRRAGAGDDRRQYGSVRSAACCISRARSSTRRHGRSRSC